MLEDALRRRGERASRPTVAVILVLLATAGVVLTVGRGDRAAAAAQNAQVRAGGELFARHCTVCHGDNGRGTDDGPALGTASPALVDFVIRTGRMPLPRPGAPSVRRQPAIEDADERAAIVAYIATFGADAPGVPDPDAASGDLSHGRALFMENCAACHNALGGGGAVGQEEVAPALDLADEVELAEAVRAGPGVMPVFSRDTISDDDLDSVIRYAVYLRDRDRSGGVAFGRSGPVSEGLIAWVVGLVGLLVIAYFLGERSGE